MNAAATGCRTNSIPPPQQFPVCHSPPPNFFPHAHLRLPLLHVQQLLSQGQFCLLLFPDACFSYLQIPQQPLLLLAALLGGQGVRFPFLRCNSGGVQLLLLWWWWW